MKSVPTVGTPGGAAKTKKYRQRVQHDEFWKLFVEACGGKCCVCGRADLPLVRGHIERHADGGVDDLSNLIPICQPCNSKHNKAPFTPHNRPLDWRSHFIKLLIRHFGLRVNLRTQVDQECAQIGKAQTAENSKVIPLGDLSFEPDLELRTQVSVTSSSPPSAEEIQAAIDALISLGKCHDAVPIPPPPRKVRDAMYQLARPHGIKAFADAGREFINQEGWFDRHGYPLMRGHEWERFADNFGIYVTDAKKTAERERQQAESIRLTNEREAKRRAEEWAEWEARRATLEYKAHVLDVLETRIWDHCEFHPRGDQPPDAWMELLEKIKQASNDSEINALAEQLAQLLSEYDEQCKAELAKRKAENPAAWPDDADLF